MNIQEIIESINYCLKCNNDSIPTTQEDLKAIKEALEKQIPKKPIHYNDSVPHDRCPNCHNAVKVFCDAHNYHYCLYCGQAIDWSDFK